MSELFWLAVCLFITAVGTTVMGATFVVFLFAVIGVMCKLIEWGRKKWFE